MSLDLGELVGTLALDITPLERAVRVGDQALKDFAVGGEATARRAGDGIGAAVADGLDIIPVAASSAASKLDSELGAMESAAQETGAGIGSEVKAGIDTIPESARQAAGEFITVLADLPRNMNGTVSRASAEWRQLPLEARLAGIEMNKHIELAGTDAANHLSGALDGVGDQLQSDGRAAGTAAARGLEQGMAAAEAAARSEGREAGAGFSDEFKDAAKDAGKVAGAAVGVALGVGVADNLSLEAGRNRLQAQLALTEPEAAKAGRIAGRIYANNFGEDLPQINTAIALVVRNANVDLNNVNLQTITQKVLTLADVFEQDLGMATMAVGQMVRTGMADNIAEALDIITVGLQGPANKADDLLETFNEYGTQFRKVGLGGADALGLISQALDAGARDADVAADAIKEFSIRAIDGSDLTKQSFKELGLNAREMAGDIAAGGPRARKGLDQVLDALRDVEDPADRARIATGLFGTQAEDLGDALYAMDVSTAVDGLGQVEGAAKRVADATGSGAQATIETYKRRLIEWGRGAIEATGPTAALAGAVVAVGPAVMSVLGPVAMLVAARATQTAAATTAAAAETAASGAVVRGWLASSAAAVGGAARMAAAWLIAIGPVAVVIAAIAGVAFLVYKYWDEIKAATGAVWDWVVDKVSGAWDTLTGFVTAAGAAVGAAVTVAWDAVKTKTGAAWDWVVDKVKTIPGLLVGFFTNFTLPGLIAKHWDTIKSGTRAAWDAVTDFVKGIPGKVVGFFQGWSLPGVIADHWRSAKDKTIDVATSIVEWVSGLPGKIINRLSSLAGDLRETASTAFGRFRDAASEKVDAVLDLARGIPGRVKDAIGNLGSLLFSKGASLIQGLIDGIRSMLDKIPNPLDYIPDIPFVGRVAAPSTVTPPDTSYTAPASTRPFAYAAPGASGGGADALLDEVRGLRADNADLKAAVAGLPRDMALTRFQYQGA